MSPDSLAHEPWDQLAVGLALDALEPQDEEAVSAHLPTCDRCRRLVEEMRGVAGDIAGSVVQVEPPPALWDRIRSAVEASDRPPLPAVEVSSAGPVHEEPAAGPPPQPVGSGVEAGVEAAAERVAQPADAAASEPSTAPAPVPQQRPRRRLLRPALALLATAAALIGAVSFGAAYSRVLDDRREADRRLAAVTSCVPPGCAVVPLARPGASTAAAVALVEAGTVRLVVSNLPSNDAARSTYVLWQIGRDKTPRAVTAFDVPAGGRALLPERQLPAARGGTTALAVSVERAGPPPPEPSTPILTGALA